jgi:hypothetical protein
MVFQLQVDAAISPALDGGQLNTGRIAQRVFGTEGTQRVSGALVAVIVRILPCQMNLQAAELGTAPGPAEPVKRPCDPSTRTAVAVARTATTATVLPHTYPVLRPSYQPI